MYESRMEARVFGEYRLAMTQASLPHLLDDDSSRQSEKGSKKQKASAEQQLQYLNSPRRPRLCLS